MIEHDGQLWQRRHQVGFGGKETNVLEKKVDFVIGSGNHAQTYVSRASDGRLTELPVSWYAEKGGFWNMSPGYDRPDQEDFRRNVPFECMFCHNGYPSLKPGTDVVGSSPIFGATLPEGIDCQRCHGPGSAHVAAVKSGHAQRSEIRNSILNPARLSRDRQMDVCMQCHLETSSRPLPYSIRRYDRGVFSYRPGEPLADYALHFDQKVGNNADRFEIAGAAYRLRQSACFRGSQMTCLTCHDPHNIPRGAKAKQQYVSVCRSCHASSTHVSKMSATGACLDCHMPKRRAQDAVHVVVTDHYIQRRKPAGDLLAQLKEPDDQNDPYRGEVVPYYPAQPSSGAMNDLYLAVAQIKDAANLPSGIPRLRAAIGRHKPTRPEFYFELGSAYLKAQQQDEAIHWFQQSLGLKKDFAPAVKGLVVSLFAAGRLEEAASAIKGDADSASDPVLLTNLGNAYLQVENSESAEHSLEQAAKLNPDLADTENLLGLLSLQKGNRSEAESCFREAIRIQPDLALAHNNLANLLAGDHKYPEAQYHFETAIALDPKYSEAHHSYGLLLELMSKFPEALLQLEHTVRLNPKLPEAHSELADLLAAKGLANRAADEYRAAIALRPDLYEAHLGLGTILAHKGSVTEAQEHFRQASLSPDPAVRDSAQKALSR